MFKVQRQIIKHVAMNEKGVISILNVLYLFVEKISNFGLVLYLVSSTKDQ